MGFFSNLFSTDEELARQYLRQVFSTGGQICTSIAAATQRFDVSFPVNNESREEISLAILGTSLAILKDNSPLMTAERGAMVEKYCKQAILKDCDVPAAVISKLNNDLDKYQDAYQKAMDSKNDPFGKISGMMLVRLLGPRVKELCLPETGDLNPIIHMQVGGIFTLAVMGAMKFWKGK